MHWCSRAPLRLGQATKCRWLARVPIFTNHLAGGNDECPLNLQATAQRGLHTGVLLLAMNGIQMQGHNWHVIIRLSYRPW